MTLQVDDQTRFILAVSTAHRVPLSGGAPESEGELPFAPDHCTCDMSGDGRRWIGIVAPSLSDIYLIRNFDPEER